MKTTRNPFLRHLIAASISVCFSTSSHAADYYWDVNGATSGTGGIGNWTTANTWRNGSTTGTLGNWIDGNAVFLGGTAGTVTISSGVTISTPRITVQTNSYAISGGTIAFGGTASDPGIIDVTSTTGFTLSSGATGSLRVNSTGNTTGLAGAAPMTINGSTTLTSFELAMSLDQNHLILGNAAALGSSSGTVKLTKGVLNLGTSATTNLSYNAWATDLAGGTIRGRFALQTWNGATTLSANSQLMTRNAADAKLIFSSTGTINLGSNTLSLLASNTSQGIDLNGVISGSGNLVTGGSQQGGTDNGNGTTSLLAANTFSGTATTTQNIGTLALGNVNALQNATLNTGLSGTQAVTFTVAGTNTYNIGALEGSDALAIGANSISLGNKAGTSTFNADISGSGSLIKTGSSSTQSLSAATSFTGATNITGGTLSLTGSGAINSSSGITISGSSAKLLHSGSTAVTPIVTLTEGTLTGSGTVNTVNVGAGTGGIISNNNGVAGAALNIGSLTFSGGASINLFVNSTTAPLNVTNLTNNASTGQVVITANNPGGWINGTTYNLINFSSLSGTGGDNFGRAVNNLSARQSPTWGNTGSTITLSIAGDVPRWVGAGDGKWNTSSTGNWKLVTAGTDTTFLTLDDVLFDDNATGTTVIDIDTANVATTSTTFDNTTKNYTLSGAFGISSGNLTKSGSGSLTISTNNTYSGPTALNAGAVTLTGNGKLGTGSSLTMNGASLDMGGSSQSLGALSITAPSASGFTLGNGNITGTSYSVSNSSGNAIVSAALLANGSAGLTKSGAGTLTLSGANTYTGNTSISNGAVILSGSGTLGSNSALSLSGGSLNLGGLSIAVGAVSITSPASIGDTISNGNLTGTSYSVATGGNTVISAGLLANGTAGFSMSGGGAVTLAGTNTYTGATSVSAGTLRAGSSTAFSNLSALSLSSNTSFDLGGFNAAFTNLTSNSTNTITTTGSGAGTDVFSVSALGSDTGASALFTDNGTRKLQVSLTSGGTGSWQATSNINNTFSGGLVLNGSMRASVLAGAVGTPGAITSGQFGKGSVTVNGNSQIWFSTSNRSIINDIIVNGNSGNGNRQGTFRIGSNTNPVTGLEISGNITANLAEAWFGSDQNAAGMSQLLLSGKLTGNNGFRFFQSANAFTWTATLNNATGSPNDYSGNTTINSAQTTLALGAADQIPNGTGKGNLILTSGTLDLAGFNETINGLSGGGTINNVAAGTANTFSFGDGDATGQTFSGSIQNTFGTLSITKMGSGTQTLSGANTYSGTTNVNAGTLILTGNHGGANGSISIASGATLQLGNAGTTGILSPNSSITNDGTLLINRSNTTTQGTDFSAGITGNGALTTTGTGTLILSGTNTYGGSTTVSNGELRLVSSTAINGTSGITVNSGRLALDGGITAGSGKSVTINGSGGNFFGSLQGNSGTNVWQGNVVIGSTTGTRIGVNGGQLTVSGVISGSTPANGIMFRPNNGTTLLISGANTYSGDTNIVSGSGIVRLDGGNDRLPTSTRLVMGVGGSSPVSGILDLNGRNQQVAGLSVGGGTANEIRSTASATLTVNTAAASPSAYSGIITGATALTKTGADTLTLSGINTYTGATTISNGTLALTASGSIANSSRIVANGTLDVSGVTASTFTIGAAQSLSGSGSVNASGKTLSIEGTHSAGNAGVGSQSLTGNLSYATNSIFAWDLNANSNNAGFDQVNVAGNLSIASDAKFQVIIGSLVNFADSFWSTNRTWDNIFNVTSGSTSSGWTESAALIFNTNGDPVTNVSNYGSFSVTGSTLTWSAVPEPTSALAGLLIAAGLLRRRRA